MDVLKGMRHQFVTLKQIPKACTQCKLIQIDKYSNSDSLLTKDNERVMEWRNLANCSITNNPLDHMNILHNK